MAMDSTTVQEWFDRYVDVFAAVVRGAKPMAELVDCYAVPLTLTTDAGAISLTTADQVVAVMESQVDALRSQRYQSTTLLSAAVTELNASSALYRGAFVRCDTEGAELGRLAVTYLLVDGPEHPQIAVLASHGR